jgi:hypothetical protein
MPGGVSDALAGIVRERGGTPLTVDVSEFLKKGGGSVKCMIGDLGPVEGGAALGSFGAAAARATGGPSEAAASAAWSRRAGHIALDLGPPSVR